MEKDTAVIIVCGGNSTRMGKNKILLPLGNTNVIGCDLLVFEQCESVAEIVIVARECDRQAILETVQSLNIQKKITITTGGETRQDSVINGVKMVSREMEYVAIHDGARPLVLPKDVEKVIYDAHIFGAATLGVPVKDTIKIVEDGLVEDTPVRSKLYITQTPQVFKKRLYIDGVDFAIEHKLNFTDDCQIAEAMGARVCMTTGSYENIKLTTPEDIFIMQKIKENQDMQNA